ncbi:hypothetical protein QY95_02931 [Bacillus thermotolerans]|uniref:Uncharacterized protein n=1 Tax=Bacillus thermotolerans TaxID=1221996 RepID=A0A0F5HVH9_BACTR|nr:hypothetical protein QY95_02931 [Bacillus thermotolerans]
MKTEQLPHPKANEMADEFVSSLSKLNRYFSITFVITAKKGE